MAHAIAQSDENTKANEFLFRRLTVEDAAEAHVAALEKAPEIGFDTFIISAPTPFKPSDCAALIADAPSVVARYFPDYPRALCAKGLDHVPVDRPRLRSVARQGQAGFRLPHRLRRGAAPERCAGRRGHRRPCTSAAVRSP